MRKVLLIVAALLVTANVSEAGRKTFIFNATPVVAAAPLVAAAPVKVAAPAFVAVPPTVIKTGPFRTVVRTPSGTFKFRR